MKSTFNREEYNRIKHRIDALQHRVENDVPREERDTAKRLLAKVSKKLKEYEKTYGIPLKNNQDIEKDYTKSSSIKYWDFRKESSFFSETYTYANKDDFYRNTDKEYFYKEETRAEEQLARDLGEAIYLIFGSTYQTYMNYHIYKVRFLHEIQKLGAFQRLVVNIYEDDILICKRIIIGFWPLHRGEDTVGDMEWGIANSEDFRKYKGCVDYLHKILREMQDLWNSYFIKEIPDLQERQNSQEEASIYIQREERLRIIRQLDRLLRESNFYRNMKFEKYPIETVFKFKTLEEFLELSGIVYRIEKDSIWIWCYDTNDFMKMIHYTKKYNEVILYLLLRYPLCE